jgi:hypothetical protein
MAASIARYTRSILFQKLGDGFPQSQGPSLPVVRLDIGCRKGTVLVKQKNRISGILILTASGSRTDKDNATLAVEFDGSVIDEWANEHISIVARRVDRIDKLGPLIPAGVNGKSARFDSLSLEIVN